MKNEYLFADLVDLSVSIGKNPAYVQGGGGNTSVKTDENTIFVKASGYELWNVSASGGFAKIDLKGLKVYLKNPDRDADKFTERLASFSAAGIKPSIETGLHVSIPERFVLHSHSVYANVLACSEEGRDLVKTLFPNSLWIDYANPGVDLIMAFAASLKNNEPFKYVFFQNHGLIVAGDTAADVLREHRLVNESIVSYLSLTSFGDYKPEGAVPAIDTVLFPDQAVYLAGDNVSGSRAYSETLKAYDYIFNMIKYRRLTHTFIPYEKVSQITDMEAEKYRKKLVNRLER